MTEIRVCRKPEVEAHTDGGWPEGLVWAADTLERRRELGLLARAGNRLYGDGSHWIEKRDVAPGVSRQVA